MTSPETTQDDFHELMYVRCAECGKWMGVKPGHVNGITHSLCDECFAREMKRLDREDKPA